MNVLILEDDQIFSDLLVKKITVFYKQQNIEIKIHSNLNNSMYYDVAFIDIDLNQDLNGIEIAKSLKENKQVQHVLFVSHLQHLVFDALMIQPFYFIRKSNIENELDIALQLLKNITKIEKVLSLTVNGRKKIFKESDVYYVEIMNHDAYIHLGNETLKVAASMQEIIQVISPTHLIRIHRSYAIHAKHLKEIKVDEVILDNNERVPMGRKYKDTFMNEYKHWLLKEG